MKGPMIPTDIYIGCKDCYKVLDIHVAGFATQHKPKVAMDNNSYVFSVDTRCNCKDIT